MIVFLIPFAVIGAIILVLGFIFFATVQEAAKYIDTIIEMCIRDRTILTKSNLPISDYSVNPYIGCTHCLLYTSRCV